MDLDSRPGHASDPACGPLTYDGHGGTDYRIRDLEALHQGVVVQAAAAGRVLAVRDGAPDQPSPGGQPTAEMAATPGGPCGNGVALDHGGGWQSHYCHLRRGSIAVRLGETVDAGQTLGLVGLSGATDYPHLEFQVRHQGAVVDPYTGRRPAHGSPSPCSPTAPTRLWARELPDRVTSYYRPILFAGGFRATPPTLAMVEAGRGLAQPMGRGSASLTAWVRILAAVTGDEITLHVTGPEGFQPLVRRLGPLHRDRDVLLIHGGRRRAAEGLWPVGRYVATATVRRGSRVLARRRWSLTLSP